MNIRVDLNYPIKDGTEVVFRSPVDCSQVTGLKVYYDGGNASQEFAFADAHGNNVGDIDHLFAENVAVKVILDVTTSMAFVQNADTNAYLEGRFEELAPSIVNESKGEAILLTDSAKAKLRGLKLYGKSEQFTTTGANLWDGNIHTSTSATTLTTTWNNDGTEGVTINLLRVRVCEQDIFTNGAFVSFVSDADVGVEATFQLCSTNPVINWSQEVHHTIKKGYNSIVIPAYSFAEGQTYVDFQIRRRNTTVPGSWTFTLSDFFIKVGQEASPYEPYTGGKPSPSPEYPQEIVSAGQDGDIGVNVGGKNLFDINPGGTASWGGLSYVRLDDGGYKYTGTAVANHWADLIKITTIVPADGVYTLSIDADVFPEQGIMYQHHRGNTQLKVAYNTKKQTYTATMQKGDTLFVLVGAKEGEVVNSTVYAQLELGSTATAFEKPKDTQTLTALTPNGLPGIKVASGGNYTDPNGQRWICDEIDFERGVYVQRVCRATEKDFMLIVRPDTNAVCFIAGNVPNPNVANERVATCTISKEYSLSWSPYSFTHHFTGADANKLIVVLSKTYTTIESAQGIYDAGFGFDYPLAEPIERPLTEEEMAQFAALQTNYPTTTILNDEGVGMEVSYVADTKNYIDKKFTELAAAIVANA